MEKKNKRTTFKIKHLVYLVIFLAALLIRCMAAGKLTATQAEAEIFQNLVNQTSAGNHGSVLYQLLTLPLIEMFGSSNLVMRFWVLLAGSLIVLLPLLYEDVLGSRATLILAGLLAIDPFASVNTIQANGSALSLLCLAAAFGFLHKEKHIPGLAALLGFLLAGQKSLYGLGLIGVVLLIGVLRRKPTGLADLFREGITYIKKHLPAIGIILIFLVFIMLLLGIELSDIIQEGLAFFTGWGKGYEVGNSPQLYPVAILAYLPVILLGFLSFKARNKSYMLYLTGSLAIMLVWIAFQPAHQLIDLIWISVIIDIIYAIKLDSFVGELKTYPKKVFIFAVLLLAILISLFINLSMFVYQIHYGVNVITKLLSLITLIVLLIMSVIFLAYNETIPFALTALKTSWIVVLFIIQIAFSWRAVGLNNDPASEALWGGYFEDADIVDDLIVNADLHVLDTGVENKVAFLDYDNAAVEWAVRQKYETIDHPFGLGEIPNAVVITKSSDDTIKEVVAGYYGQDFIANRYPLWIWQPLKSLIDGDFWYWMFFRQGTMVSDHHYIWIEKTLFQ